MSNAENTSEKSEKWKSVTDPKKVLEAYYSEGNYYHYGDIVELAQMTGLSHKNVRDTLCRFRKRDEKAGKFVPPPPRQQNEFSDEQREILEDTFEKHPLMGQWTPEKTREICEITGLKVKQVNNWLCHQRRKLDGRGNEKDRRRRRMIKLEKIRLGTARVSAFSPPDLDLMEALHLKAELAEIGGKQFKIPYGELVEKTGKDRKKIRDWFSKRKLRDKNFVKLMENQKIEQIQNEEIEDEPSGSNQEPTPPNDLHQNLQTILNSLIFPDNPI
ncbi:hypothetical protein L5515_003208 [Caenorhabditis briggsae]|uniref:Homeobox domain-containing protein n=1 Tax=Caenorhabditis briggsae TaxID=6238 RepID=A0AAE9ELD2_CAEBR|nr:hypothetical protein L5515_003208 [Caenorhabditis briggsae]